MAIGLGQGDASNHKMMIAVEDIEFGSRNYRAKIDINIPEVNFVGANHISSSIRELAKEVVSSLGTYTFFGKEKEISNIPLDNTAESFSCDCRPFTDKELGYFNRLFNYYSSRGK